MKIRHAIILQSDAFQLGKGSLFDLHRDILGSSNTRKIELAEALDKGKNYLLNYQTVLIDEAKSSGSWSEKAMLINTLKQLSQRAALELGSCIENILSKILALTIGLTPITKMHSHFQK